ncbi:hypothetical protein GCM10025881_38630 [Pseudolysinimonas kribbensis]|uniref:Pyruvate kinase C-terminal domain-containing protein n=1 Tax=Pseudolysinimonas kribbensis TaxID=433641 RepID=A0ABQ6KEJ5_9MICO|nr:hypothetical protein GCM10025881_38630 [Pseudolysinimonas kribbensis]
MRTDDMFGQVDEMLLGEGLVAEGDKVVVISGSPPGIAGSTNDMRVHVVGTTENPPVWETGEHAD